MFLPINNNYYNNTFISGRGGTIIMETIIDKLSQIESAAMGILAHTNVEKAEYETSMKQKRIEFDKEITEQTTSTVDTIRLEAKQKTDAQLAEMKNSSEMALKAFQDEYDTNHTNYATQIFRRITTF